MNARDVDDLLQARKKLDGAPRDGEGKGDGAAQRNVVFEKFILYSSEREHDAGSRKIMLAIQPVREDFRIIDVSTLHESELPEWLDGTPILVDMRHADRIAYKGSEALRVVQETYPCVEI